MPRQGIQIKAIRQSREAWLRRFVAENNLRHIGNGCFGEVYAAPKSKHVFKVCNLRGDRVDFAYMDYVRLLLKLKKPIKWAPHVSYAMKVCAIPEIGKKTPWGGMIARRQATMLIVKMERLAPFSGDVRMAYGHEFYNQVSCPSNRVYCDRIAAHKVQFLKVLRESGRKIDRDARQMQRIFDCLAMKGHSWDMHYGNAMLRGARKQLVFTDPVC